MTVTPAGASISGGTQQFTAEARDSSGAVIPGAAFTWTSLNPNVATIDPSTGLATAIASGQVTVSASVGGVTGYGLLTVAIPGATPVNLWVSVPSPAGSRYLEGVWGYSSENVFAVGDSGTVLSFDGGAWSLVPGVSNSCGAIPTQCYLTGVWGSSPDELWVVGAAGMIQRRSGGNWEIQSSPSANALYGMWGSAPNDLWIPGEGGRILRYDGTSWQLSPNSASPSIYLNAVWGTSRSDIWVGGQYGTILRYDGSAWQSVSSGTSNQIEHIWGSAASEVWAVGRGGTVLRFGGSGWQTVSSPTSENLYGVWGSSTSDVWAVGASGTILAYNGATWQSVTSPTSADLFAVWGTGTGSVWAVGNGGTIVRGYRGATAAVSPANPTITALGATVDMLAEARDAANNLISGVRWIWTSSNTSVATVDSAGVVTAVANGTTSVCATAPGGAQGCTTVTVTVAQVVASVTVTPAGASISGGTQQFTAEARDSSGAVIPGAAFTWTSLNPNVATIDASSGVARAVASGQAVIAASVGTVTGYAVASVAVAPAAPINLWVADASPSGVTWDQPWGVSPTDVFLPNAQDAAPSARFNGSTWSSLSLGAARAVNGVGGASATDIVFVGNEGEIRHTTDGGASWADQSVSVSAHLMSVWAASPRAMWAVGGGTTPTIVHYDGSSWNVAGSFTGNFYSSWGFSSQDVYAVGGDGSTVIYRYDGSSWSQVLGAPSTGGLQGVWGAASNDVFAVGAGGAILHYNGSSWSPMSSPTTADLEAVWGSSSNDVYAVGRNGTVLRYDGSSWSVMTTPDTVSLRGIWMSSAGPAFAVGYRGTIWRGHRGATVAVTPAADTIIGVGSTTDLLATATDASGNPISGVAWTWSSSDTSIARVDTAGVVTATGSGTVSIIATAPGGAADTATIRAVVIVSIVVSPSGALLSGIGSQMTFTAEARDVANNPIQGVEFTWSSLNPNVATISSSTGQATAIASGQATVAATAAGITGHGLVTVSVPGLSPVNLWATMSHPGIGVVSALWAASPNRVFATDAGGQILEYDGTSWSVHRASSGSQLIAIWGTSAADIYAVGAGGLVLHFDGSSWQQVAAGLITDDLYSVWGSGPNDVYVGARSGELLHWDGEQWSASEPLGFEQRALSGIWGWSRDSAFIVGWDNAVARLTGSSWVREFAADGGRHPSGIWGESGSNVIVVLDYGRVIRHNGSGWSEIRSTADYHLHQVHGTSGTDVYITGGSLGADTAGVVLRWNGNTFTPPLRLSSRSITAVWADLTGVILAGGAGIWRGHRGATVAVTPAADTIIGVGSTTDLLATATDASGNPISGVAWTWSSSDTSIARVDTAGVVTAVGSGTVSIIATAPGGAADTATIRIFVVSSIVVTPAGASLTGTGSTTSLSAEARDETNQVVPGIEISWSSLNPAVATVDGSGVVTSVTNGQAVIRAASSTDTGYALVTVAAPYSTPPNVWVRQSVPDTAYYGVWGSSGQDVFVTGRGIILHFDGSTWTTQSSPTTMDLHAVWGTSPTDVFAVGGGATDVGGVVAHYDGTGWSVVHRPDNPQRRVWSAAPNDVFAVGDPGSQILHYNGSTWTVSNPVGGGIRFRGVWGSAFNSVLAVTEVDGRRVRYNGTAWAQEAAAGTAQMDLWGAGSGSVFSVGMSGTAFRYDGSAWNAIPVGVSEQFNGVGGSGGSDVIAVSTQGSIARYNGTNWSVISSGWPSLQDVWVSSTNGDVFVVGAGVVLRGYRGATVAITPASPSTMTALGETHYLLAEARDASGAPISGVTFTWTSSNPAVATVDTSGLVTAVGNGTTQIIATAQGGAADTVTVTVRQVAATVEITPQGVTITSLGTSSPFTLTVLDSNGYTISSPDATWASLNPNVADFYAPAAITTLAAGQVTVAVTVDGVTDYSVVTVAVSSSAVTSWETMTSGTTSAVWDVWGTSADNVFAVTSTSSLRWNGTSWSEVDTSFGFRSGTSVAGLADTSVYRITGQRVFKHNGALAWAEVYNAGTTLDAIWVASPRAIFAVATNQVHRFNGTSWVTDAVSGNLNDVYGFSETEVYAVGEGAVILRYDGSSWSSLGGGGDVPSGALYGVWGTSGSDLYVTGNFGLWRYDGTSWTHLLTSGSRYGIWGTGSSDIYFVGGSGSLQRWDGSTVSTYSGVSSEQLESVWGYGSQAVYVVGWNGTILRGTRSGGGAPIVTEGSGSASGVPRRSEPLFREPQ
ncbi:MAG TPA: Ig-like domain-containing protein [Gemmatimonadales bacterium]|nr:Ig-like domain-containing protein [Gemmatimonadales bacterium]